MRLKSGQSAFTLVELMIASSLSVIVVVMVLTVLVQNAGTWRGGLARARVSEQGRMVRERILHGINGRFGLRHATRSQLVLGADEILFYDVGANNPIILDLKPGRPPAWLDASGSNLVVRGGLFVEDVSLAMNANTLVIDLKLGFMSDGRKYIQPQNMRVYLVNE